MVEPMPAQPLETTRLRLDPWSKPHTGLLVRLAMTPEVMQFIGEGRVWSRQRAEDVAAHAREHWRRHGFGWRAAIDRETGVAVGVSMLNFAGEGSGIEPGEYEIGWWLQPSAWGNGLAREGAIAIRDEAFCRVGAPSVVARIAPGNAASLSVATAIGLMAEGESRGRFGEPIAVLRLTVERWRGERSPNVRARGARGRDDRRAAT